MKEKFTGEIMQTYFHSIQRMRHDYARSTCNGMKALLITCFNCECYNRTNLAAYTPAGKLLSFVMKMLSFLMEMQSFLMEINQGPRT